MARKRRPTFAQYEKEAAKIEAEINNSWSNKVRRGTKRVGKGARSIGHGAIKAVNAPLEVAFRPKWNNTKKPKRRRK